MPKRKKGKTLPIPSWSDVALGNTQYALSDTLSSTGRTCERIKKASFPLHLRLPKLKIDPHLDYKQREGEEVVIAFDATRIKVTNRGEWTRKEKKGHIKIQGAVDTKTKQVISLEMTDERTFEWEKSRRD